MTAPTGWMPSWRQPSELFSFARQSPSGLGPHGGSRVLDPLQGPLERCPRIRAALLAPDAVERIDEGPIASDERLEGRQRGRRCITRPRARLLSKRLRTLERVRELRHALGSE